MKPIKRRIFSAALALSLLLVGVGAAFAATGDATDPLISLSYLQQTVLPGIFSQVDVKAKEKQTELERSLSNQITQYKADVQAMGSTSEPSSHSYTLVTLTQGQTLQPSVGCELLLRVGTAKVNAAYSPALVDVSAGSTINNGTSLTKNHLYMATIAGHTVVPTAATVKILVRGEYTIA